MNYINRQIKITPQAVANMKEGVLNEISEALYDSGEITKKFLFKIEYDEKRWRRFEKSILEPDDTLINGVLIVNGSTPIVSDFIQYTEYYMLTFLSTYSNRDELEIIFREFQAFEATVNKSETTTINGTKYSISKIIDGASMPNKTDALDGSAEDKAYFYLTDNWTFSIYIMNSNDIKLTINNEVIEYISLTHDLIKNNIASSLKSGSGKTLDKSILTSNTINLILPLVSNKYTQIELFLDSRNSKLVNKTYNVKLEFENGTIFEEEMEILFSSFTDNRPNNLAFSVMLGTKKGSQQIQIKIPGEDLYQTVDYSEFRIEKVISGPQDPSILEDDSTKMIPSISSRLIYLLIPLTKDRTIENIQSLLELDIYTENVEALYDIRIIKHGIVMDYEMVLTNGLIGITEEADEYIAVTFTERRDL